MLSATPPSPARHDETATSLTARISRYRRALAIGVAVIVAILIAATYGVPVLTKRAMETQGSAKLGRAVSVGKVSFNPLTLTATLADIKVAGPTTGAPTLLTLRSARVSVAFASLWHRAPVLDSVSLEAPTVAFARLTASSTSIDDVIQRLTAKRDEPTRFAIENIAVREGSVLVDDRVTSSQHVIEDIEIGIPFLSNLPRHASVHVTPRFAARVGKTAIALVGNTLPFADGSESTLDIDFKALDLAAYIRYWPEASPMALPQGLLDADLTLRFRQQSGAAPRPDRLIVTGNVALRDFALVDRKGDSLLAAKSLAFAHLKLEPFADRYGVASVLLRGALANVQRDSSGALNWVKTFQAGGSPIVKRDAAPASGAALATLPPDSTPPAVTPLAWRVGSIAIADSAVNWRDATRRGRAGAAAFEATVRDIALDLGTLDATVPTVSTTASFKAVAQSGETIALTGSVSPLRAAGDAGPMADIDVVIEGALPATWQPYWQHALRGRIDGAAIGARGKLVVTREPADMAWRIAGASVSIGKGALHAPARAGSESAKQPVVSMNRVAVTGINIDSAAKRADIAQVSADGFATALVREAGQSGGAAAWNVMALLPPPPTPAAAADDEMATPWQWRVASLGVKGGVLYRDEVAEPPVRIRLGNTSLEVSDLLSRDSPSAQAAVAPRARIDFQTSVGRRGSLRVNGSVAPYTPAVDINVDAKALDLGLIEPYVSPLLNVQLSSGRLTWNGRFVGALPTHGPLAAHAMGKLAVTEFVAQDKTNAADFLRWKTLDVDALDASVGPEGTKVDIGGVVLANYYARIIVNQSGRLNLQDVLAIRLGKDVQGPEAPAPSLTTPAPAANPRAEALSAPASTGGESPLPTPSPRLRLGKVSLVDGNIDFTDNFIRPNYSANLTEMTGLLGAVASDAPQPAAISLRGYVDGAAPVSITGRANPLVKPIFIDMTGEAKGIELTRLSAYSAKYAGYAIDKGKLSMDIKYFVENNRLKAENRIFLDQLTFGERVEGPDVTRLPVRLAVSLLTNARGEIDINLPISGSIDDPEFSVGGLIWQVIVNLFSIAVTSPFSLIASAFGGGDELSDVRFKPGTSQLDDAAAKRIGTLASAMKDRPQVKLTMTAEVDVSGDAEPYRRARLAEMVRAEKLRATARGGRGRGANSALAADAVAAVVVTPEEYPSYLEAVYKAGKFPKPRNVVGLLQTLPAPEMEALLLANIAFGDSEQRALAEERAAVVTQVLRPALGDALFAEKVFASPPKLLAKDGAPRVGFALK